MCAQQRRLQPCASQSFEDASVCQVHGGRGASGDSLRKSLMFLVLVAIFLGTAGVSPTRIQVPTRSASREPAGS